MLKTLRIAVTALCLTECVLFVALWVRSYWTLDLVSRVTSTGQISSFGSNKGTVYFVRMPLAPVRGYGGGRGAYGGSYGGGQLVAGYGRGMGGGFGPRPQGWQHSSGKVNERAGDENFQWEITGGKTKIKFPHWLIVLGASAMAAAPWVSYRFSLRTLLIATTLVAVVLGAIVLSSS
jgi:hypothetical protein